MPGTLKNIVAHNPNAKEKNVKTVHLKLTQWQCDFLNVKMNRKEKINLVSKNQCLKKNRM